jgi:uncharacterized protein (DUF1778 family)
MPKTLTLRIEDKIYKIFKEAAKGENRSISNFIEKAAYNYLISDQYVSDEEMNEIVSDKALLKGFKNSLDDIKKGNFKIVG